MSGGEGDGALDAEPTVERWRVVVVALATVAALPLFVLENPSSPGALTGTADAATRLVADATRIETIELVVATPTPVSSTARPAPSVAELSSRARDWHLARSSREAQDRMAVVAHEHEAEALAAARLVAANEFAERAELDALLEARQREADREAEQEEIAEEQREEEEREMRKERLANIQSRIARRDVDADDQCINGQCHRAQLRNYVVVRRP